MRFAAAGFLFALGCQPGSGGAVSVRWRIANLQTGEDLDPRSACVRETDKNVCGWHIDRVGLKLTSPSQGSSAVLKKSFACSRREATTDFDVEPGQTGIALVALDANNLPLPDVITPPPQLYSVVAGQIVTLDILELGVDPAPLADSGDRADCALPRLPQL